jgi:shikimate dehydrogenase
VAEVAKLKMDQYAVIGNPVSHSLSPQIHTLFADETEQDMSYRALQIEPDKFEEQVRKLQSAGFKGLNVTVPFKQNAWEMADVLSPRARDAGAVNTLILQPDGKIAGDNTDGIGLIRDLIVNHNILIEHRKILILGAGGAVRGALGPILAKKPGLLTIANRTLEKAEKLAEDFYHVWDVQPSTYENLGHQTYDLIINGTSAGLTGELPPIPESILGASSVCYDMMYNARQHTAFVKWALDRGALRAFDGLGMLVEQAAEAFFVWRGKRPQTSIVIQLLREKN